MRIPKTVRFSLSTIQAGLLVVIIVLALTLGVLLWHRLHGSTPSVTSAARTTINDKNYTLTLPVHWKADSSYVSGTGLGTFADEQDAKSRLIVFVTPVSVNASAQTHIDNEITALKKNGGSYQVLDDTTIKVGPNAVSARRLSVAVGKPSDPNDLTYYVYTGITNKQTIYNIDVILTPASWQSQRDALYGSLDTFAPKTDAVNKALTD